MSQPVADWINPFPLNYDCTSNATFVKSVRWIIPHVRAIPKNFCDTWFNFQHRQWEFQEFPTTSIVKQSMNTGAHLGYFYSSEKQYIQISMNILWGVSSNFILLI